MRAVLRTLDGHRRAQEADRARACAPLWLTLDRNLEWWSTGALLRSAPADRVRGLRARLAVLPRPGPAAPDARQLRQAQRPLAAAAQNARLAFMLDELLPLAAARAGGVAWEYYFSFGGGAPPWVSGLAAGHRRAGARARGDAAAPRGRRAADRQARAGASSAGARRPASACRPSTATTTRSTRSRPTCACSTASSSRSSASTTTRGSARTREGTALFQAAEPRGARRGPDLRHRRVVAVLARQRHARVVALLPRPAAGLPHQPVQAHRRRRSTARPPSTSSPTRRVPPELAVQSKHAARRPLRPRALQAVEDLERRRCRSRATAARRRVAAVRRGRLRQADVRLGRPAPRRHVHGAADGARPGRQRRPSGTHDGQGAEAQDEEALARLPRGSDGAPDHPLHGQGRRRQDVRRRRHRPPLRRGRRPHARALDRPGAFARRVAAGARRAPSRPRSATACGPSRCRRRRSSSATGRPRRSGWAACWPSAASSGSPPRS